MKNSLTAAIIVMAQVAGSAMASDIDRFTVSFSPARISWNPHYAYTTTEAQIFTAIYEGLVSFHPATLRPVPGSAESWVTSADGRTVTFRLRENLKWSNGERLTAEDFRQSWLNLLSPETGAEYGSLLDDVVGAREYRSGNASQEDVGIRATDSRTLVVELKVPSPQFLAILCHYSFVPVHRDFRLLSDWSAHRSVPVNGPYVMRSRSPEEVVFDRNPEYWDRESVAIDGIRMVFSNDSEDVMRRFNRFETDWIISGMDTSMLAVTDALNIGPQFSTTYYYFSNRSGVWSNPDVRRALALLVPWEELRNGRLIPGTSLVPPIPNYPGADAGFPRAEDRLAAAMNLLETSGFAGGRGLPDPVIRIPQEDPVARAMEQSWRTHLGLNTIIEIVEFPDYYDSVKRGGYDLATLTWTGDYADPLTFLGMWESTSSFNEARFSDPSFDRILTESATLPHLQRLVRLRDAEEILLNGCQVMPVEHFPAVNIIDRRFVDGWYPNALDIHPFKNLVPKLGYDIPGVVRSQSSGNQGLAMRFTLTNATSRTP